MHVRIFLNELVDSDLVGVMRFVQKEVEKRATLPCLTSTFVIVYVVCQNSENK